MNMKGRMGMTEAMDASLYFHLLSCSSAWSVQKIILAQIGTL